MIHQWKKALLDGAEEIFQRGRTMAEPGVDAARVKGLHAKIGDWMIFRNHRRPHGAHGVETPVRVY